MRVAIYCRVSTEEQAEEGYSLHAQERILTEYARQRGWDYVVFHEVGTGTSLAARPVLQDILAHLSDFSAILVVDLDRLSRLGLGEWEFLKGLLRREGVKVITPSAEYTFEDVESEFLSDLFAILAHRERRIILARTRRGMEEKLRQGGKWGGLKPPYGYRWDGEKFVPIPDEWLVVKEIFHLARYHGQHWIARHLNAKGIPSPTGARWYGSEIRRIIQNPIYAGRPAWGKSTQHKDVEKNPLDKDLSRWVWVNATVEAPILSFEEWLELQRRRKERKPGKTSPQVYYLSGLVKCPICGRGMIGHGSVARRDKYYACPRYKEGCFRLISAEKVEWILPRLFEVVKNSPEVEEKVKEMVRRSEGERKDITVEAVEKRLREVEEQKRRLIDFYLAGGLSLEEAKEKMSELEQRQQSLLEQKRLLEQRATVGEIYSLLEVVKDLEWDDLTEEEKKEFARLVVSQVRITAKGEVEQVELYPLWHDILEKCRIIGT